MAAVKANAAISERFSGISPEAGPLPDGCGRGLGRRGWRGAWARRLQGAIASTGFRERALGGVGERVIGDSTDQVAERMDGIDRSPDEGFATEREGPGPGEKIREISERMNDPGDGTMAKVDKAAKVASVLGAGQVETALDAAKDVAKVGAAFFREGVEGNSPFYDSVMQPLSGVKEGASDAQVHATISQTQARRAVHQGKEEEAGQERRGREGQERQAGHDHRRSCVRRTVEVDVKSQLKKRTGPSSCAPDTRTPSSMRPVVPSG